MSDNIRRVYLRDKDGNILSPVTGDGGISGSAVSYESQDLTEAQQMQARANQGLYYEDGTPAGTITWNGDTTGLEKYTVPGSEVYKVADVPKDIPIDAFLSYTDSSSATEQQFTQVADYGAMLAQYGFDVEGICILGLNSDSAVIVADNFSASDGETVSSIDGICFTSNIRSFTYDAYGGSVHPIDKKYLSELKAVEYVEQSLTEAQYMQARKNQDLYYEESSTTSASGSYNVLGEPTQYMTYSPNSYFVGYSNFVDCLYAGYYGIGSNEPIGVSGMVVDSVQLKVSNQYHDAEVVTQTSDYILVRYAYSQYQSYYGVIVWAESANVSISGMGTLTVPYGTWLSCNCGEDSSYFGVSYYTQEIKIEYHTTSVTTNQVPAKYIPTQSINASSDNSHFATTKAVYDIVGNVETLLAAL